VTICGKEGRNLIKGRIYALRKSGAAIDISMAKLKRIVE